MTVGSESHTLCHKCQSPIGEHGDRCPFCGSTAEPREPSVDIRQGISIRDKSDNYSVTRQSTGDSRSSGQCASISATRMRQTNQVSRTTTRVRRKPEHPRNHQVSYPIVIGGVIGGLLVVAAIVVVALALRTRPPEEVVEENTDEPEPAHVQPLEILGIVLHDGPVVDPTDLLHTSRERVADGRDLVDVKLLGIVVRGASNGKVNLEDPNVSLTYQFMVVQRDIHARKADERRGERVELVLQRDAPQTAKMFIAPTTRTPPEPICIWSAAWTAASASGMPNDAVIDVDYALDPQRLIGVWTFTTREQPKVTRIIDGQTCAIKNPR